MTNKLTARRIGSAATHRATGRPRTGRRRRTRRGHDGAVCPHRLPSACCGGGPARAAGKGRGRRRRRPPARAARRAQGRAGSAEPQDLAGRDDELERVWALGVPEDVFDRVADRVVEAWRARAATEYPSDLADHPADVRLTPLAALVHSDGPTSPASWTCSSPWSIGSRPVPRTASRGAGGRPAPGTEQAGGPFRLARAALAHPDRTVREALYLVVGEETLRDLVAKADAEEAHFRARVRTLLRSWSHLSPLHQARTASGAICYSARQRGVNGGPHP